MLRGRESVDNDQPSATTWTRKRENAGRLISIAEAVIIGVTLVSRRSPEQLLDPGDIVDTVAVSEETIVADTVLALWQDVDQEAADELVGLQRHNCASARAIDAVVFDLEGHAVGIEPDQATV